MAIQILGAGMAGLLCARMLLASGLAPQVFEKQKELPDNHSAVLRFRSDQIGKFLGIPFKPVKVLRATMPIANPVAAMLLYSAKTTGQYRSDRSLSLQPEIVDRFIAPQDFTERLYNGIRKPGRVFFEYDTGRDNLQEAVKNENYPIISTIPMPVLMAALDYEDQDLGFRALPAINLTADIYDCEAYCSLYVPQGFSFSRISITGNRLIVECSINLSKGLSIAETEAEDWPSAMLRSACLTIGIDFDRLSNIERHFQKRSKILPVSDARRKAFMYWATHKHNVYSLGRYATWRPGLLLDDLVQDIRLIEGWITGSSDPYERTKGLK